MATNVTRHCNNLTHFSFLSFFFPPSFFSHFRRQFVFDSIRHQTARQTVLEIRQNKQRAEISLVSQSVMALLFSIPVKPQCGGDWAGSFYQLLPASLLSCLLKSFVKKCISMCTRKAKAKPSKAARLYTFVTSITTMQCVFREDLFCRYDCCCCC